jgi:dihydroorotase
MKTTFRRAESDSENSHLLKNIHIVDPLCNRDEICDVWIDDGLIKAIDQPNQIKPPATIHTIDGTGCHLMPGFVDVHVHLREPGQEYKETIGTGTMAAAAGGFTTVLCMANTNPVNDNPYVTSYILSQAEKYSYVRVLPIGALSKGLQGKELAEIGKMKAAGIVAVSDDGMPVMNSYLMRKALDYCKTFGLVIVSHAEDAHLVGQGVMHEGYHSNCLGLRGIPAESEEIVVARDIALSRLTGGAVHFAHLSTRQALDHVRRAKAAGLKITCEVTPHHLMFTDEDVGNYDSNFKMAPPLRTKEDVAFLREALGDGTIDCVATDHAPHAMRDKDVLFEFASNGVVGLETAFSVVFDLFQKKILTLKQVVEVLSVRPSAIFNLPQARLAVGDRADCVIVNLAQSRSIDARGLHSKSKNSPFLGRKMAAVVQATFVGGVNVFQVE